MLTTNPGLTCHKTENKSLFIWVPGKEAIQYTENCDFYLELLYLFDGQKDLSEILERLENSNYSISSNDLRELTDYWIELNILKIAENVDELIFQEEYMKYDRQIKNFGTLPSLTDIDGVKFQRKLEAASVGVVGIGGVGSYIAYGLAAMGIGKLKLVDGDIVELSNTSRQILYNEDDINRDKTTVAEEKLRSVNKKTIVETKNFFVNASNINELKEFLSDVDLIIQCADTPRGIIEYLIDDVAYGNDTPWITFAPLKFSKISLGPLLIPGETKSLRELIPPTRLADDYKIERVNERFVPTIMDPYNGIAAKMALIEIVKFLTGYKKSQVINRRIVLDTDNWEVNFYEL